MIINSVQFSEKPQDDKVDHLLYKPVPDTKPDTKTEAKGR